MASIEQLRKVGGYLDLATNGDCEVLTGGGYSDPAGGFWVEPTVLTGVDPDSPLMREEVFGPVTALVPVPDFDAALAAANDTEFGLSAALFTRDLGRSIAFAREIAAGQVHINRETAGAEPHVPFGGLKGSSNMQREQGKAARRFFTNTKNVYARAR